MLLNCGVGEDSWESLGLQGDPTSSFWRRSALVVFGRNDAKAETPVLWPPHAKSWLIGKTLMLGGIGGRRRRGRQRTRWLDGITDLMDACLSELWEMVMNREAWRAAIHGVTKSRTWLSDWAELRRVSPTLSYCCLISRLKSTSLPTSLLPNLHPCPFRICTHKQSLQEHLVCSLSCQR